MGDATQLLTQETAEHEVRCLRCGYDLRGAVGERCSECGWEIDWAIVGAGAFAWERRRYLGRVKTYLDTLPQVGGRSKEFPVAVARKHSLADAKSFARVTGAMVAIALVGIFYLTLGRGEIWRVVISAQTGWPPPPPRPVWVEELLVPWSAGVTLVPVVPVMLIALAFAMTSAPRRFFVPKDGGPVEAESAQAIGCYVVGPLAILLPAGIFFGAVRDDGVVSDRVFACGMIALALWMAGYGIWVRLRAARKGTTPNIWFMPGMLLAAAIIFMTPFWLEALGATLRNVPYVLPMSLAGLIIFTTLHRIVQWVGRVRKLSTGRAIVQGVRLAGLWLIDAFILLGILPWCIGLGWIVVDSFR